MIPVVLVVKETLTVTGLLALFLTVTSKMCLYTFKNKFQPITLSQICDIIHWFTLLNYPSVQTGNISNYRINIFPKCDFMMTSKCKPKFNSAVMAS